MEKIKVGWKWAPDEKNKKCVHKFDRKTSKASPLLKLKSGWKIPNESSELGLEDVTCIGLAEFCVQW